MSKGLLHDPATIDRLRRLRAKAGRWLGRRREVPPQDRPEAILRELGERAIFMLSFGRSGTTVFGDFLASHPEILKMGEVLNEQTFRSFFRSRRWFLGSGLPSRVAHNFYLFLRDKVRRHPRARLLFDMKFEMLHLADGNYRDPGYDFGFFDAVLQSGCPVILIERRDHVARYLSLETAVQQGRFHSYQSGRAERGVTIDVTRMARVVAATETQVARVLERFAAHPKFMHVAYEDMFLRDGDGASRFDPALAQRVATLLGVDNRFDAAPRLERLSGSAASDPILNRAEVEAWRASRNAGA